MKGESVASFLVGAICLALFTVLLLLGRLNVTGYAWLLAITAFLCIALLCLPRARELDFRNLRITLDQMQNVKSAIYAKAEDLKRTSLILADLILFNSEVGSRYGEEESLDLQKEWNRRKCNLLLESLAASAEERDTLLRYVEFYRRFDEASPEDRNKFDINEMIRTDIGRMLGAHFK